MEQTHTFTSQANASQATTPSHDSVHPSGRVDIFEAAMTELREAGIGFVVLTETEPIEQAA